MRYVLPVLTLALALAGPARPDEATDLRDRALKAAAKDPADLKKLRCHTIRAKGVSKLAGAPVPATFELAAVYPGQLRLSWEFGAGAAKNALTIGASDDRAWKRLGVFPANELSVEELNDLRADAYAIWVSTLVTLNDSETRLAVAGRSKVDGAPVVGLRVSRRPWPDITLWFDEKTHLLRKMAYRSRDTGALLNKEMTYGAHKDVAGLMVPTTHTTVVQGKEIYSWVEMEYAFPEKIDASTFAKP